MGRWQTQPSFCSSVQLWPHAHPTSASPARWVGLYEGNAFLHLFPEVGLGHTEPWASFWVLPVPESPFGLISRTGGDGISAHSNILLKSRYVAFPPVFGINLKNTSLIISMSSSSSLIQIALWQLLTYPCAVDQAFPKERFLEACLQISIGASNGPARLHQHVPLTAHGSTRSSADTGWTSSAVKCALLGSTVSRGTVSQLEAILIFAPVNLLVLSSDYALEQ